MAVYSMWVWVDQMSTGSISTDHLTLLFIASKILNTSREAGQRQRAPKGMAIEHVAAFGKSQVKCRADRPPATI
jgi:hypothetical protein